MWAIVFVLSTGASVYLNVPDATQQKEEQCLAYGAQVAAAFNLLSANTKVVSGHCWRRA